MGLSSLSKRGVPGSSNLQAGEHKEAGICDCLSMCSWKSHFLSMGPSPQLEKAWGRVVRGTDRNQDGILLDPPWPSISQSQFQRMCKCDPASPALLPVLQDTLTNPCLLPSCLSPQPPLPRLL